LKINEFIYGLLGTVIFISPLLEASWDVWSKTVIHSLTIILLLVILLQTKTRPVRIYPKFLGFFALFIAWLFVTNMTAKVRFNAGLEFNNWVNYLLLFLIITNLPDFDENKILKYVTITTFCLTVIAFYERITSTALMQYSLFNANILSGYLVVSLPVMFYYLNVTLSGAKIYVLSNMMKLIGLACVLACLLFTKSAGAIAALVVSVMIVMKPGPGVSKPVLYSCMALVAGLTLVFIDTTSLMDRYFWWQAAIEMFVANPLTGIGLGGFEFAYPAYKISYMSSMFAHNTYLQLLAETGIAGLALFIVVVVYILKTVRNICFRISIIACLAQNLFDYNLYILATGILFWIITFLSVRQTTEKQYSLAYPAHYFILIAIIIFGSNVMTSFISTNRYLEGNPEKAVSLAPDLWLAYDSLAQKTLREYESDGYTSDIYETIPVLQTGLKYNPYNTSALLTLAQLYRIAGEYQQANRCFAQAVASNPYNAVKYNNLWKTKPI
jgi:O-antigen ligase